MVPSCVPASPFEKAVGRLRREVAAFLRRRGVQGLGEAMDYLGLVHGAATGLTVETALGRVIDGHAPDLSGRELAAYMLAGPLTDHETSDPGASPRAQAAGDVAIGERAPRPATSTEPLPFSLEYGTERTALCTDDRHAATLAEEHHIDGMVARLVAGGVPWPWRSPPPSTRPLFTPLSRGARLSRSAARPAARQRTRPSPPRHGHLRRKGGLEGRRTCGAAPSFSAAPDSPALLPGGDPARKIWPHPPETGLPIVPGPSIFCPGSIITEERVVDVKRLAATFRPTREGDVCLVAVMERHTRTGEIGTGLSGLGLRSGAIATTVAHDAHHLLVAGVDPTDMLAAAQALAPAAGGLALARGAFGPTAPPSRSWA